MSETEQRFPSLSHWGAFTAVVRDGQLLRCEPFARDGAPSNILQSMPALMQSGLRIARPAIRQGWLKQRHLSDRSARGHDAFVELGWDEALEIVAQELARVRSQLAQAVAILDELGIQGVGVVGLAKARTESDFKSAELKSSLERIFIPGRKNPVPLYPTTAAYKLLTHIRDEAHRFAITYHRNLRDRRSLS